MVVCCYLLGVYINLGRLESLVVHCILLARESSCALEGGFNLSGYARWFKFDIEHTFDIKEHTYEECY
jgi:hypothetical protein